ncbi:MAG: right-handed parallel beta-helix repeat-containing protein [Planctomycetota bacterium]
MRPSKTAFFLCCLFVAGCTLAQPASAEFYYVRKSGDDSRAGTSRSLAFRTLAKAASVAGQGDTIFIGAGTYDESAYLNAARKSSTGWLTVYGDRLGVFTGDRGDVVIRSREQRWGIQIDNAHNVIARNLRFESQPDHRSHGIGFTDSTGLVSVTNCSFDGVGYSIRDYGGNSLSVSYCKFEGDGYGPYGSNLPTMNVSNCAFSTLRFGFVAIDNSSSVISDCQFSGIPESQTADYQTTAIYAETTDLVVRDCDFDRNYYGVYGREMTGTEIDDCQFNDMQFYTISCYGEDLSMSDSTVSGAYVGVVLGPDDGSKALLRNVQISGARGGVVANSGDYHFDNVTVTDCYYGIYQNYGNRLLSLTASDDVRLEDNEYAIYSTQPNEGDDSTRLVIDGQKISGNARSVRATGRIVEITDSAFVNKQRGVSLQECPSVTIRRCNITGNAEERDDCYYGILTNGSTNLEISQCRVNASRYGLYLYALGGESPTLKDNQLQDHYVGLRLHSGTWVYTDADGNSIRDAVFGFYADQMQWKIDNATVDASCQVGIAEVRGAVAGTGLKIPGGVYGLYSHESKSVTLADFTIENCTQTGLDIRECGSVAVQDGVSRNNRNGMYVLDTEGKIPSIRDCAFSGNASYGLYLAETTLSNTEAANLTLTGNRYGLVVRDRVVRINPTMGMVISNNEYGIYGYRAPLEMSGIALADNAIGAYVSEGAVQVDACKIRSTGTGILANLNATSSISDSIVSGGNTGIRFNKIADFAEPIQIARTQVMDAAQSITLVGQDHPLHGTITECSMSNGTRGLSLQNAELNVSNSSFSNLQSNGIYQYSGSSEIQSCQFTMIPSGTALYSLDGKINVARSRFSRCRYGVGLSGEAAGRLTNSTIDQCIVGIYTSGELAELNVYHATIARAQYGVLRYRGAMVVRNSILQSSRYGMYNSDEAGRLDHSNNLVHGPIPYHDTTSGDGESTKDPMFVNASAGDLRLASGSPAINAGMDLSQPVVTDIDGHERPSFHGYEMGAHEFMEPNGSLRVIEWDEVAK